MSKLGDPAQTKGRSNLTLQTVLLELEDVGCDADVLSRLRSIPDEYPTACSMILYRRNKYIAHYDRQTMLDAEASQVPRVSRAEIEQALDHLRRFMNTIQEHYERTTTSYQNITLTSDANHLVEILKRG